MSGPMQMVLDALPITGSCKTVALISDETGIEKNKVSDICCRLMVRKLVRRERIGCYNLTSDGKQARDAGKTIIKGPAGPRTGRVSNSSKRTTRDMIWRVICAREKVSVPQIQTLVNEAKAHNIRAYLSALAQAGYLQELKSRERGTALTSNGFKVYLLLPGKNTGPRAPVLKDRNTLYDRNTDETVQVGGDQ